MLTIKTPTDQILQELKEEEPKAKYWLKKQFHGERGYEAMRNELCDRAVREHKNQRSEVFDYISPKGNRWMIFESARYVRDIHYAYPTLIAFCYYETYGSVGAFLRGHSQYGENFAESATIFTDHFFLRFCQRLGIEMRSRWMVQKFMEIIPGIIFHSTGQTDEYGRYKVDCRFPGSIGRGIIRNDGPLIEICTYLTDAELNGKQKRETKDFRLKADKHNFDPMEIKMARLLRVNSKDMPEAFEKEIRQIVNLGADENVVNHTLILATYIMRALCDLNYADAIDYQFWLNHGEVNKNIMADLGEHYAAGKPIDESFIKALQQIFKNDDIKDYDLNEFINYMLSQMREDFKKHNINN